MAITVEALWRYPVKSLRGEQLDSAAVDSDGFRGDRLVHAVESSGRVITARYRPGLLGLQGTSGPDGEPMIEGEPWNSPAALAAVRAVASSDTELVRFAEPDRGQRFDVMSLTVLTDGAVAAMSVDYRRFRPNILLGGVVGLGERNWIDRALRIGDVLVGVWRARPRCVMTTYDPDTLEQDHGVLRRIVSEFDGRLALDCWVVEPGQIGRGDTVRVEDLPAGVEQPQNNAAL